MKIYLSILLLLTALQTQAGIPYLTGEFGINEASNISMPQTNSGEMAAAIYKALDVKAEGPKETKMVNASDGVLACDKTPASCSILTTNGKITSVNNQPSVIIIMGASLSEAIYEKALINVEEIDRTGGAQKEVGNLSCTKKLIEQVTYSCRIKDVIPGKGSY